MKQKPSILIPNATSPRNLGDRAMLGGLLSILSRNSINYQIIIHSVEPEIYSTQEIQDYKIKHRFYSWSVLSQKKILTKLLRITQLLILLLALKIKFPLKLLPIANDLKKLVYDYKICEYILFAGGGYLRSKKGITQALNLIMQCYPFIVGKILQKNMIVGAISFGPFAYTWQQKLVAHVLNYAKIVMARENISYKLMKEANVANLILTSDFALFLENRHLEKQIKSYRLIGLTVRKWFQDGKQTEFENQIVSALKKFANQNNIVVQPIVQVNAPMFGDDDKKRIIRIVQRLKDEGIKVYDINTPQNIAEAFRVYSKIDILVGMRMHSNILAALCGTPFVAISYEHKTEGIVKSLNMENYCISCDLLNKTILFKLIKKSIINRKKLSNIILKSINKIRFSEFNKMSVILANFNYS